MHGYRIHGQPRKYADMQQLKSENHPAAHPPRHRRAVTRPPVKPLK
jgi:hypothetical protein